MSSGEGVPTLPEEKQAQAAKKPAKKPAGPIGENTVLIGSKPVMGYVVAALIQFNRGGEKVILKARGKAISRAVDVAEILKNKFLPGQIKVGNISINTERVGEGEQARDVSTIEIVLERAK